MPCEAVTRVCQAQVRKELPLKCTAAKAMHKTPPLAISSEVKEKDMSGYKACMFIPLLFMAVRLRHTETFTKIIAWC